MIPDITKAQEQASDLGVGISDIRDKRTGRLIVANRTPRTRYYTPDGREQWKIPQRRERSDGLIYDVFLAEGYTLEPPQNPKCYCKGCDRWHDTEADVGTCIAKKTKFVNTMTKKAEKELTKEGAVKDKRIQELEEKIDKLTKLMKVKLG